MSRADSDRATQFHAIPFQNLTCDRGGSSFSTRIPLPTGDPGVGKRYPFVPLVFLFAIQTAEVTLRRFISHIPLNSPNPHNLHTSSEEAGFASSLRRNGTVTALK
jgi:hypothetical protein